MISQRCIRCGKRVEWTILAINLGLFALKFSFAILSNSRSLHTDAFQSLANFIITAAVLVSLKMASRAADEKFPYGYGKVEFLASGVVNMLLMVAAAAYMFFAFAEMMMVGPERPPRLIAIFAAVISIIANQMAFKYGRCAGQKLSSAAILANAQVSRADVGTSVAVIVAVVGSNLGLARLDHIVSIVICVLIIKVAFDGIKKAVKGLMDVSLRVEEAHIRDLMDNIDGVGGIERVTARFAGRSLLVDMSVSVPRHWPLSTALQTVGEIKNVLHTKMKNISQISVQLLPAAGRRKKTVAAESVQTRTYVPQT